ncbi:type VI secretion system Vgr family protein [Cupriavidus campinensis]
MARQSYFLKVPGATSAAGLSVVSFEAVERLGEPYEAIVQLTHPLELDRADYLGKPATFLIDPGDESEPRTFAGCITRFSKTAQTPDFHAYEMVVEPLVARLRLTRSTRIYQHQTAPEIIEAILRRHELVGHQFSFRLRRQYPQHAFRFQYQMSDWETIRLLMEQEGLYSYFLPGKFGEMVVFGDDIDHYLYKPELRVPYRETAGLEAGVEAVIGLRTIAKTVPASFLVADYNPDLAWEPLKGEANVARKDKTTYGQPYVFGTHHLDFEGARWEAQLRHEAAMASQVVYEGESNVLELRPARILRMDLALADAPNGQVITEVVHTGARDAAYRNTFKSIPSDRRFRLPLDEAKWPKIQGTLSARITSPSQYQYAYLTQQGYYTVRFDFDFEDWPGGGECVPLRLAKPFAGALQTGFHFPLIDGTEAAIAFRDGNPNKPYIAHVHHNSRQTDLITNQDRWLSRNVMRTQRDNKIELEDWEGQEHVKLSTEHSGKSQLTLGHMVDGKWKRRGEGFELRTSGWGAIRGGKGLLITADDQPKANGQQLDMQAALGQLQVALAQAEGLADAARMAKAEIADLHAENRWLKESMAELKEAVMVLSAPAGIAAVTPERIEIAAGKDVSIATSAGFNLSALANVAVAASGVLSLFAHKLGIKLFAARGKVSIQAQSDAMELVSDKDMKLTSADGTLTANAANGVVISGGGSAYIKVHGDDVEIGGAGNLILKIIEVMKFDPGALSLPLPRFGQTVSRNDERFILTDQLTGRALAGQRYKIRLANGREIEGVTNAAGETTVAREEAAQGMTLLPPCDGSATKESK